MPVGLLSEIWRYPVSGLQGEKLEESFVLTKGIPGDHTYVLRDIVSKRVLDPKTYQFSWGESLGHPSMLRFAARFTGDPRGAHQVSIETQGGRTVCSTSIPAEEASDLISDALGTRVELVTYPRILQSRESAGRALHLITTASLKRIERTYPSGAFDVRRFRPNLVIDTNSDLDGFFVEDGWVGRGLKIGDAKLHVEKPNARCKVTTMKQSGIEEDPLILETIKRENAGNLGVMCSVLRAGALKVGDPVYLA